MDKTQSEVTEKIRYAIKKKLVELNLFVDDELPDYIMILIANKRSKHHMEKDLSLFLGNQTADFTNWLWDLVNSLKVSSRIKNTKVSSVESKGTDIVLDSKDKVDEDDVLNYDPAEQGETLCLEELNEPSVNPTVKPKTVPTPIDTKPYVSDPKQPTPISIISSVNISSTKPVSNPTPQSILPQNNMLRNNVDINPQVKIEPPAAIKSAKVYPLLQAKQNLSNLLIKQSNTSIKNYHSVKSDNGSGVNSVICVAQRKYGGPAALQANKLLLKAVSEAAKSVLNGKDVNDYYKPTPIKDLVTYDYTNDLNEYDLAEKPISETNIINKPLITIETNISNKQLTTVKPFYIEEANSNSDDHPILQSSRVVSINKRSSEFDCDFEDSNVSLPSQQYGKESEITPHFIVTLDGVNLSSLKRKYSMEEPMEVDDEGERSSNEDTFEKESTKKQKITEKCKYWPACKNSENCSYHHPTIPCKTFPECKFGDKCLYIHPNCKFDSLCSRKDCPYTHCSKRNFKTVPIISTKPVKIFNNKVVCKYYPKCTAKSCRFIHPKPCRFGTQCRTPSCRFSHFQVPQRNQLKWTATTT